MTRGQPPTPLEARIVAAALPRRYRKSLHQLWGMLAAYGVRVDPLWGPLALTCGWQRVWLVETGRTLGWVHWPSRVVASAPGRGGVTHVGGYAGAVRWLLRVNGVRPALHIPPPDIRRDQRLPCCGMRAADLNWRDGQQITIFPHLVTCTRNRRWHR